MTWRSSAKFLLTLISLYRLLAKDGKKFVSLMVNESLSIDLDEFNLNVENYSAYVNPLEAVPDGLLVGIPEKISLVRERSMLNPIRPTVSLASSDEDFFLLSEDCSIIEKSSFGDEKYHQFESSADPVTCLGMVFFSSDKISMLLLNSIQRGSDNKNAVYGFDMSKKRFRRLFSSKQEGEKPDFSKLMVGEEDIIYVMVSDSGRVLTKIFRLDEELLLLNEKRSIEFSLNRTDSQGGILDLFFNRSDAFNTFRLLFFYSHFVDIVLCSYQNQVVDMQKIVFPSEPLRAVRPAKAKKAIGDTPFDTFWLITVAGSATYLRLTLSNNYKFGTARKSSALQVVDILDESEKFTAMKYEKLAEGIVVERGVVFLDHIGNIFYSGTLVPNANDFFAEIKFLRFSREILYVFSGDRLSVLRVANQVLLFAAKETSASDISISLRSSERPVTEKIILTVAVQTAWSPCLNKSKKSTLNVTLIYPEVRITSLSDLLMIPAPSPIQKQSGPHPAGSVTKPAMHELLSLRTPFNEKEDPVYIQSFIPMGEGIPEITMERRMRDIIQLSSRKLYLMGSLSFFKEENLIYYDENYFRLPNLPTSDDLVAESLVVNVRFDCTLIIIKSRGGAYYFYLENMNEQAKAVQTNIDLSQGCQILKHFSLEGKIYLVCLRDSNLKVLSLRLTRNDSYLENYQSSQVNFPRGQNQNLILHKISRTAYVFLFSSYTSGNQTAVYQVDFSMSSLLYVRGARYFPGKVLIFPSLSESNFLLYEEELDRLAAYDARDFLNLIGSKQEDTRLLVSKKILPLYGHRAFLNTEKNITSMKAIFYDSYLILAALNERNRRSLLVFDLAKPSSYCLVHIIELNDKFDSKEDLQLELLFRSSPKARLQYALIRLFKNVYAKIFLQNSLISWALAPPVDFNTIHTENHTKAIEISAGVDQTCRAELKLNISSVYFPDGERVVFTLDKLTDFNSRAQIDIPDESHHGHRLGLRLDYTNCAEEGFRLSSKVKKTEGLFQINLSNRTAPDLLTEFNYSGVDLAISINSEQDELSLYSKLSSSEPQAKFQPLGLKGAAPQVVYKENLLLMISKAAMHIFAVGPKISLLWSSRLSDYYDEVDEVLFDFSQKNQEVTLLLSNRIGEAFILKMKPGNNQALEVKTSASVNLRGELYKTLSVDLSASLLRNVSLLPGDDDSIKVFLIFDWPLAAELAILGPEMNKIEVGKIFRGYENFLNTGVYYHSKDVVLVLAKQKTQVFDKKQVIFYVFIYFSEANSSVIENFPYKVCSVGESVKVTVNFTPERLKVALPERYFKFMRSAENGYCLLLENAGTPAKHCFNISNSGDTLGLPYLKRHNCSINVSLENFQTPTDEEFETYLKKTFSSIYEYNPSQNFEEVLAKIAFFTAVAVISVLMLVLIVIIYIRKKKGQTLIEEFISANTIEVENRDKKVYHHMRNSSEIELEIKQKEAKEGGYENVRQSL